MQAAEINSLPERVRRYILSLHENLSAADLIQENFRLEEENKQLRALIKEDSYAARHG